MFTEFNMNDYIYVELTNEGWDLLEKSFKSNSTELMSLYKNDYTKTYLVNGASKKLTQFQLHQAICIFGDMSPLAFHEPFKNCRVYFKSDDLIKIA